MITETLYPTSIEFTASETLESQRIPDPYTFYYKKGALYSPITDKPVRESITRRDSIEETEYQAFIAIEDLGYLSIGGTFVWISPPVRFDLSAKAIISEIQSDPDYGKILVNRNICFEWDPELFLGFVRSLGRVDIKTGEDFRGKPIFLHPKDSHKIYDLLERMESRQIQLVYSGEDWKIKEKLKADLMAGTQVPLGNYPRSCDGAFNTFLASSLGAKYCERCPACGVWIGKIISIGYPCVCGAVKRC